MNTTTPNSEKEEPTSGILKQLAEDFAAKEDHRFSIALGENEVELKVSPLNTEDQLKILAIDQENNPSKKGQMIAGFLVAHVKDGNGDKAFKNCMNMPAAQVLRDHVDPETVMKIYGEVCLQGKEVAELEDAEKK